MTRFGTKRKENKEISLDARLTTSVYIRLLGNVACNCVVIMFLSLWYFINRVVTGNTVDGMPFTMNWGDTHAAFDLISQYAESSLTAQDMEFSNLVPFWVGILYGILFFLFWGFGQEAVNSYWAMWTKFRKVVGMPEKPLQ